MSLNNTNYLRIIPADILINPKSRTTATFKEQINAINERVSSLDETVDMLNKAF